MQKKIKAPAASPAVTMAMKKAEGTSLATPEQVAGMFDVQENMEGVEPRLPQIRIAHQAQVFKMPDDTKVDSIEGIIIDSNRCNAFWAKSFEEAGSGNPPDCFSLDAVKPNGENPCAKTCAECKNNRYGTDGGRGKACKNMRRVHILVGENILPFRLSLPPSSLRAVDDYLVQLTTKGRPYPTVVTQISLTEATNKDNIAYSRPEFEMLSEINDLAELAKIKELRTKLRATMQLQEVTADEFASGDEKDVF
jgi:hypothetical protein